MANLREQLIQQRQTLNRIRGLSEKPRNAFGDRYTNILSNISSFHSVQEIMKSLSKEDYSVKKQYSVLFNELERLSKRERLYGPMLEDAVRYMIRFFRDNDYFSQ